MLLQSRAIGGPLDGIVVSGGQTWTGRLTNDRSGRYKWDYLIDAWRWVGDPDAPMLGNDDEEKLKKKRRGGRPRKEISDG